MLYRWLRDLHLYFGLFISPFILLFAVSVFYLNHGKLIPGATAAETYRDLNIPDGFDRLKGREAVDRATTILPQVGVSGEIGFLRYVARDRHLIFPVSKAGSEATVDVDLDARSATVKRRSMNLWESLSYLHKMPGPHNVAIRGNWVGIGDLAPVRRRHHLSAPVHFAERHLPVVGHQGRTAHRCSAARRRRIHVLRACLCRHSLRRFEFWNRKLHYYLGLYFLFFLWLFSLTGLMLNHQQWFSDLYARHETHMTLTSKRPRAIRGSRRRAT